MDIKYEQLSSESDSYQELNSIIINTRNPSRKVISNKTMGKINLNKNRYCKYICLFCGCFVFIFLYLYISSKSTQLALLKATNINITNYLHELTSNKTILQSHLQSLNDEQQSLSQSTQLLSETLLSTEETNKKLTTAKESHDNSIKEMRMRLDTAITTVNEYKQANEEMQQNINKLKQLINQYEDEINTITSKIKQRQKQQVNGVNSDNGIDSVIINNKEDIKVLRGWIEKQRDYTFELLYRGSRDGFSPSVFHSKVDHRKYTLSLIQSKSGNVFGGYTSETWDAPASLNGNGCFKYDNTAFIFNLDHYIRFQINDPDNAIYAHPQYYLVYGKGDIMITPTLGVSCILTSYGKVSYETPEKLIGTFDEDIEIEEIEVFQLVS